MKHLVKGLIDFAIIPFMEERRFLHDLCSKALRIDKSIEFVAVIDFKGKLIVGTFRKNILRNNNHRDANPSLNAPYYVLQNNSYPLATYRKIVSVIRANLMDELNQFQIVSIDDNMHVLHTPINEEKNKYLCLYFKSYLSLYSALLKVNTIFH
ncbi:MAG: hypothetical protein M3162_03205 [Thermoproteota archaeon]|nr:hypothetical protein [Thermoproteota archaeon]